MRLRNIVLTVFISLFTLIPAYSLTIDEVLEAANDVSYTVKNAEISHSNSLLLIQENDLEDEALWNVEVNMSPLKSDDLSSDSFSFNTLNASVTLPNDGNTTFALSSPMSIDYDGGFSITPYLSASHTFDFNYFDDDLISDLSNAVSSLSTERVYLNALYSFNKSVISQLINLLTLEKNIKSLEHSISNAERDLENMVQLRTTSKESITYKRTELELDMNRRNLEIYKDQYEKAKSQFKISTNLEWTGLEDFEVPELNIAHMEGGNSELRELSLKSEIASLSVEEKEKAMSPRSLTLSAGGGVDYKNDKSKADYEPPFRNSVNGDISATLNLSQWKIGTSFSLTSNKDWEVTPVLSIFGSWHNNTTSRSDSLELERLRNEAISAQNDYMEALTDYNIEGMSLQNRIMDYNFSLLTLEQNETYLKAVVDSEKEYYEKGLVRKDDVDDAIAEYELFSYDKTITYLDGLSLYYDILIYSL